MKKIILSLFLSLGFCFSITAQDYQTGVGVRGGLANGLTVKHFVNSNAALEGILTSRWEGFMITGLYEIHKPLNVDGFHWYYGPGAHIGFFGGYNNHPWFDDGKDYVVLGVDFVLGLEYVFEEVPISLSLDWKPGFNLTGHGGFWGDDGGLAIRYTFK